MPRTHTKTVIALSVAAVVMAGVGIGRHLLAGGPSSVVTDAAGRDHSAATTPTAGAEAATGSGTGKASVTSGAERPATGDGARRPDVPVAAVTPQVVHTATIAMRVGRGELEAVLRSIATVAGTDGGYVGSSSVSGGTARRSPVDGSMVIRVVDADFADAITRVTSLGTVQDQSIKGTDVTIRSAQNAASLAVLQDEVTLLEKKLAEAPDITSFLQIENQLLPVEQQQQQLQSAQAVLTDSAAMATVTVHLTAPGAPVTPASPAPTSRPQPAAGTVAWRYLRHNSLAVLDGLGIGLGWGLPGLVLLALVGSVALRVLRRRRRAVSAT